MTRMMRNLTWTQERRRTDTHMHGRTRMHWNHTVCTHALDLLASKQSIAHHVPHNAQPTRRLTVPITAVNVWFQKTQEHSPINVPNVWQRWCHVSYTRFIGKHRKQKPETEQHANMFKWRARNKLEEQERNKIAQPRNNSFTLAGERR